MCFELFLQPADLVGHSAVNDLLVCHGLGQIAAGDAQELRVSPADPVRRGAPARQQAQHRRHRLGFGQDQLGGSQLLLQRAVVGQQHIAGDQRGQVLLLEAQPVDLLQGGASHGLHVEGPVTVPTSLVEDALILRRGQPPPGAPAHMDAPLVAHGRRVARPDRDHRMVGASEAPLLYQQGGRRHDVAVGLDVGKAAQQVVGDSESVHRRAVVLGADEHHAGRLMARQVVGKGADGLAYGFGGLATERLLALDPVGFEVIEQRGQFRILERLAHGSYPANRDPGGGSRATSGLMFPLLSVPDAWMSLPSKCSPTSASASSKSALSLLRN